MVLRELTTTVRGRTERYTAGGEGSPVLFLHDQGDSFRPALEAMATRGMRVLAPARPGSDPEWVTEFLHSAGIREPVAIVGHGLSGAVAVRTAHATLHTVQRLILIDSIGASALRTALAGLRRRELPVSLVWSADRTWAWSAMNALNLALGQPGHVLVSAGQNWRRDPRAFGRIIGDLVRPRLNLGFRPVALSVCR
ncbi:alpha/beta fold hydrolase [Amycolatopsis magusensis]|uniref:alpha/beta fold hydrolase n=1 Tax=Amycolatopsis magusensis TaxID=882444 RepID=UPI003794D5F7